MLVLSAGACSVATSLDDLGRDGSSGSDAAPDVSQAEGGTDAPMWPDGFGLIACPNAQTTCDPRAQACCAQCLMQCPAYSCVSNDPDATAPCSSFAAPCSDFDSCTLAGHPGDACCASTWTNQSNQILINWIRCLNPASCNAVYQHFVLCNPSLPSPCPDGGACVPASYTSSIKDYFVCQ
jgi:hypothetical protein